jgi:uncharacterized protein (UPF0333 family)
MISILIYKGGEKMNRKGQAAMEFLMTYGWAILAAVIVIAVLASFGVFSPSKYVPQTCIMSAPFGCVKNQVSAVGQNLTFVLTNGGGEAVDVTSIVVTQCGSYGNITGWLDGAKQTITIGCTGTPLVAKQKFTSDVVVNYQMAGGSLPMKSSGSITVEAS